MLIQKQITFERWDGKQAVFQLDSGQEIALPKDDFSKDLPVGAVFMLKLLPEHEARLEQQELARTLLNQILADDSASPQS